MSPNMEKELQEFKEIFKAEIHLELLKAILNVPDWKMPGHDSIHGFWLKKFTYVHNRMAVEQRRCREKTNILEQMTKRKTNLIQEDIQKGTIYNNYRLITWLPIIRKILTVQIREASTTTFFFESLVWLGIWFLVPLVNTLTIMPMGWATRVQSSVESYQRLKKWYLMPLCFTLSIKSMD